MYLCIELRLFYYYVGERFGERERKRNKIIVYRFNDNSNEIMIFVIGWGTTSVAIITMMCFLLSLLSYKSHNVRYRNKNLAF